MSDRIEGQNSLLNDAAMVVDALLTIANVPLPGDVLAAVDRILEAAENSEVTNDGG